MAETSNANYKPWDNIDIVNKIDQSILEETISLVLTLVLIILMKNLVP